MANEWWKTGQTGLGATIQAPQALQYKDDVDNGYQGGRDPEGGGPGGPGGGAPNTPCAPGYTKKFQPDGSFTCEPPGGQVPECGPNQVHYQAPDGSVRCVNKCPEGQDLDRNGNCFDNPVNPPGGSGSTSGGGGSTSIGGTPASYNPTTSPYDAATSKAIFDLFTGIINGGELPYSADTIAKLQAAAVQSNKSQLANSRQEVQRRLINAGLSRSGVAPATYGKLENAAAADLSTNIRNVAVTAAQSNFNAKMGALQAAQQFLQSERANALSQDQLILGYARLKQERELTQAGFDQQWKVIQNGNEQEIMKLLICLRTGVC